MRALIHDHTDFLLHFFQLAVSAPSASSSSSSESSAVAIGTGGSQKNAALSPISVSIVVAMVASGAKGPTLQQILSTINLPSSDTLREFASQVHAVLLADATSLGGPLLEFANSVWVQQTLPLNPSFTEVLHSNYGVAVHPADFLNQVTPLFHLSIHCTSNLTEFHVAIEICCSCLAKSINLSDTKLRNRKHEL